MKHLVPSVNVSKVRRQIVLKCNYQTYFRNIKTSALGGHGNVALTNITNYVFSNEKLFQIL